MVHLRLINPRTLISSGTRHLTKKFDFTFPNYFSTRGINFPILGQIYISMLDKFSTSVVWQTVNEKNRVKHFSSITRVLFCYVYERKDCSKWFLQHIWLSVSQFFCFVFFSILLRNIPNGAFLFILYRANKQKISSVTTFHPNEKREVPQCIIMLKKRLI